MLAGVENPHGHEELSTGALYLFQVGCAALLQHTANPLLRFWDFLRLTLGTARGRGNQSLRLEVALLWSSSSLSQALARRLDEAIMSGAADEVDLSFALAEGPRSPTAGEVHILQQAAAAAATSAGGDMPGLSAGQVQERGPSVSQPAEPPLLASSSGCTDLSFSLWRSSSQPTSPPDSATAGAGSAQLITAAGVQEGQLLDRGAAAWQMLLVPLAAVARVDVRPRVADTAAAVLLQVLKLHGGSLGPQQWLCLYQAVLQPLLALPADFGVPSAVADRLDSTQLPLSSPTTSPALAAASGLGSGVGSHSEAVRRTTTMDGHLDGLPTAVPTLLSFEGLHR